MGVSAVKDLTPPKKDGSTAITEDSQGHVIGIAAMATGFGPSGLTFLDALGGKPPPACKSEFLEV